MLVTWLFDSSGIFVPSNICPFILRGFSGGSADTRGCRSSSSEIANTGTVTWSSSTLDTSPWSCCWLEGAPLVSESMSEVVIPFACGLEASDAPESRPKHGVLKRVRRRLLVELSRRWRWAGRVRGYEALLMKESEWQLLAGLRRGASERTFPLPVSVAVLGSP